MVRSASSRVSNHEARGPSFETPLRGSFSDKRNCAYAGMRDSTEPGFPPSLVVPPKFACFMPDYGLTNSSQQKILGGTMTNSLHVPDQTAGAASDGVDRRRLLKTAAALAA